MCLSQHWFYPLTHPLFCGRLPLTQPPSSSCTPCAKPSYPALSTTTPSYTSQHIFGKDWKDWPKDCFLILIVCLSISRWSLKKFSTISWVRIWRDEGYLSQPFKPYSKNVVEKFLWERFQLNKLEWSAAPDVVPRGQRNGKNVDSWSWGKPWHKPPAIRSSESCWSTQLFRLKPSLFQSLCL